MWIAMPRILLSLGQAHDIVAMAHSFLLFSLPDLLTFSFIHPIRIYLRSQGITRPLDISAAVASLLLVPLNLLLVRLLGLDVPSVAASASNLALLLLLLHSHLPRSSPDLLRGLAPSPASLPPPSPPMRPHPPQ